MNDLKWTASGGDIVVRYAIVYEEPKPRWWVRFVPAFLRRWLPGRQGKILATYRFPESGEPPRP